MSDSRPSEPLTPEHEAEIEFRFWRARDTSELSLSQTDVGVLLAEVKRLRTQLAAEPPQPSPEHQAIYLDEYDQVWCDYPTVPADDQVLPLVWASEVAQSRRDLADGGNKLRVIGWCR